MMADTGLDEAMLDDELSDFVVVDNDGAVVMAVDEGLHTTSARGGVLRVHNKDRTEHFEVPSWRVSVYSDPFNGGANDMAGVALYRYRGQNDWTLNKVHCKTGYLYVKTTANIASISCLFGQVHGKLYKSLFDTEPDATVVATGFAFYKGQWRFRSMVFNGVNDKWHNNEKDASKNEAKFILKALQEWMNRPVVSAPGAPAQSAKTPKSAKSTSAVGNAATTTAKRASPAGKKTKAGQPVQTARTGVTASAGSNSPFTRKLLEKITIPDLKAMCGDLGVAKGGNKPELIERVWLKQPQLDDISLSTLEQMCSNAQLAKTKTVLFEKLAEWSRK